RPLAGVTMYSRAQIALGERSLFRRGWGSWLELYHLDEHPSYNNAPRPMVDLSILETRWGTESLTHYTFETVVEVEVHPTYPCVTGQNALTAKGTLLIPSLPLTDRQQVRASTMDVAMPLST